ncbi:hypothetical protein HHI36_023127 [Cryptolaemus montrouzieri]|uniref:Uncharacterized protein n=1 Tax=Cryptolaemus montrouzieri TaxID=559131 RepID=A0ABD2PFE3_9CUCU
MKSKQLKLVVQKSGIGGSRDPTSRRYMTISLRGQNFFTKIWIEVFVSDVRQGFNHEVVPISKKHVALIKILSNTRGPTWFAIPFLSLAEQSLAAKAAAIDRCRKNYEAIIGDFRHAEVTEKKCLHNSSVEHQVVFAVKLDLWQKNKRECLRYMDKENFQGCEGLGGEPLQIDNQLADSNTHETYRKKIGTWMTQMMNLVQIFGRNLRQYPKGYVLEETEKWSGGCDILSAMMVTKQRDSSDSGCKLKSNQT